VYKTKTGKEVKVTVDKSDFLPDSTGGGVLLTCFNGKIVVDNTLEKRLETAIHQLLPAIRYELFGPSLSRTFFD
jgi:V-type H+-transporting ATPase subunit E